MCSSDPKFSCVDGMGGRGMACFFLLFEVIHTNIRPKLGGSSLQRNYQWAQILVLVYHLETFQNIILLLRLISTLKLNLKLQPLLPGLIIIHTSNLCANHLQLLPSIGGNIFPD